MSKKKTNKILISEKKRFTWNCGTGKVLVTEIELGKHARKAYILDNFLSKSNIKKIYSNFAHIKYGLSDYDRSDTSFAKHFAVHFDKTEWEMPHIKIFESFARAFLNSQNQNFGRTARIHANLNMFGDFQFTHIDLNGWTALVFLNHEWKPDWGGDLLLHADKSSSVSYSILPVPGRVVVFDGLIPHRGGAPSKYCPEARLSLAIKALRR